MKASSYIFNFDLKYFLKNIALAVLILLSVNVLIHFGITPDAEGNLSAILVKQKKLKATNGGRLLLVGGSSVVYGYDSKRIEEVVGRPVINAGLHAGLGLDFYISFIKGHVKKGDQVVLIPEYNMLLKAPKADRVYYLAGELVPEMLAYKPEGRGVFNHLKAYVLINKLKVRRLLLNVLGCGNQELTRASVNERGDAIYNEGQKPKPRVYAFSSIPEELPTEVIILINELNNYLEEKGATLYLSYAPLADIEFTDNKGINRISSQLQNTLNVSFFNEPIDQRYGNELFYDTYYHLNVEGRKLNTERFLTEFGALSN